jgi:ATP-dependent Clp protease ATP-binding subunit ClpA
MSERFTPSVRRALYWARVETGRSAREAVGTEHLLLGLTQVEAGAVRQVWVNLGLEPNRLWQEARRLVVLIPGLLFGQAEERPYTAAATRVLERAGTEATDLGCDRIQTTHLLLALLADRQDQTGQLLRRLGLSRERVIGQYYQVPADPPARELTFAMLGEARRAAEGCYRVTITDEAIRAAVARGTGQDETALANQAMHLLHQAVALVRSESAACTPKELRDLEAYIDELNQGKEAAVAEQDFERAAAIRDEADRLKRQLRDGLQELRDAGAARLRVVDAEAVAAV